jgi:hypothetical protein
MTFEGMYTECFRLFSFVRDLAIASATSKLAGNKKGIFQSLQFRKALQVSHPTLKRVRKMHVGDLV